MSSMHKRGFRLPWGAERSPEADAALEQLDGADDPTSDAARDDLGEGPFNLAGATRSTTDAVPAASDVPEDTAEAAMMDAENHSTPLPEAPPEADTGGWPVVDRRSNERPFVRPEPEPRMPRRDNPLVAGLVKAMREAAIASREETTARLQAEATARVEAIRARATTESTVIRKRADDDVIAIREWSKTEIARVRQETDDKIEARKSELGTEAERHTASVNRLVDEVQTTVSVFEADMDRFFKRLLAEDDPARLATLAEQAPDPPDLRGDGPPAVDDDALEASAAAAAEAEATEGLEDLSVESWPGAVVAASHRPETPTVTADANGPEATRLLVSGLTSVAGISAFKGALGQLPGVRSVSVSSGEPGMFVFAVGHDAGVDLDAGVASLAGFSARITDATDDGFTVLAHEPAA
jgi:hypothetical protein